MTRTEFFTSTYPTEPMIALSRRAPDYFTRLIAPYTDILEARIAVLNALDRVVPFRRRA